MVCACRDFTEDRYRLFDFCSIKNTILDSESGGSGTELADIMDTIEKQQYVEPSLLMQHFWNVFVVDALLGNKLDGRKINYYDFLMSAEEPECNAAIQRMVPKINMEQINGFIDEVPFITELQKTFYKRYISARFEHILRPAYDMVLSEKQELSEPTNHCHALVR